MEITVRKHGERQTASAYDLADDYKSRGMDKYAAWDHFVIDRGLKPEMNAKEFYAIFENAAPIPLTRSISVSFSPTHYDTLLKMDCQIAQKDNGIFEIVWADGHIGTNPPAFPPESERYQRLAP